MKNILISALALVLAAALLFGGNWALTGIREENRAAELQSKLQTLLPGDLAVLQNLFYAVILILVVIYGNAPALKHFRERYNVKAITNKIFKKKKKGVVTEAKGGDAE